MKYVYESVADNAGVSFYQETNNWCRAHYHKSIEIVYVLKGKHRICINGESKVLKKDEISFAGAFNFHYYTYEESSEILVVVIPQKYTTDFFNTYPNKTFDKFLTNKEKNKGLLKLFKAWRKENSVSNYFTEKGFVSLFMGNLLKYYSLKNEDKKQLNPKMIDILRYLESNFQKKLDLQTLALKFGYNKTHFSRMFNSCMNESIISYINKIRAEKALFEIMLLKDHKKECNMLEVALNSGFESLRSFYRIFKSIYGATPNKCSYGNFISIRDNSINT